MPETQDHYEILGVSPSDDADAIKLAYRKQIRRYHPDKYTGERAQLKAAGKSLGYIDRKIRTAKRKTQRVNAAYAVLSDPQQRRAYDRQRRNVQHRDEAESRHPDAYYDDLRVNRYRHHRDPRTPRRDPSEESEAIPWILMVGFIIVVALSSSFIGDFLWSIDNTRRRVTITPIGFSAGELQATTSAEQATRVALEELVAQPSPTPLTSDSYLAAAKRLMNNQRYADAVELYGRVLESQADDADIYLQRGQAYAALYREDVDENATAAQQAVDDFAQALALDADLVTVYRARGLLRYAQWQQTNDAILAADALNDLTRYTSADANPSETVTEAIATLQTALSD